MTALFSYIIYSDSGFAPNPFFGYCTLATCKPGIRRMADIGDWVMATGTEKTSGRTRLVHAMRVSEKLPFERYFLDPRFARKIVIDPDSEPPLCCGDNMFFKDSEGRWSRAPASFRHAEVWRVRRDLEGKYVLISEEFYYFGRNAVEMPLLHHGLIHLQEEGASLFDGENARTFVKWLRSTFPSGIHGEPWEYITRRDYGKEPELLPNDLATHLREN